MVIDRGQKRVFILIFKDVDGRNLAPNVQQVLAGPGRRIGVGFIQRRSALLQRRQPKLRRVALRPVDRSARVQVGRVTVLVEVIRTRITAAAEGDPVQLWSQVLRSEVALVWETSFSGGAPRSDVLNATELHQRNPTDGMRSGTCVPAARQALHHQCHRGPVTEDCIQAACAVGPSGVSLHDFAFAVQNGLRAGWNVSDVGNPSRQLRSQSLHESDHDTRVQFQPIGRRVRPWCGPWHITAGRQRENYQPERPGVQKRPHAMHRIVGDSECGRTPTENEVKTKAVAKVNRHTAPIVDRPVIIVFNAQASGHAPSMIRSNIQVTATDTAGKAGTPGRLGRSL